MLSSMLMPSGSSVAPSSLSAEGSAAGLLASSLPVVADAPLRWTGCRMCVLRDPGARRRGACRSSLSRPWGDRQVASDILHRGEFGACRSSRGHRSLRIPVSGARWAPDGCRYRASPGVAGCGSARHVAGADRASSADGRRLAEVPDGRLDAVTFAPAFLESSNREGEVAQAEIRRERPLELLVHAVGLIEEVRSHLALLAWLRIQRVASPVGREATTRDVRRLRRGEKNDQRRGVDGVAVGADRKLAARFCASRCVSPTRTASDIGEAPWGPTTLAVTLYAARPFAQARLKPTTPALAAQ